MRKILILSLALTLLLAACGKVDPPMTTDVPITTQAPETTAPMTTEIPETTETPVTTEPPVRYEQPAMEVADEIEKQAIDAFFGGGKFDFVHYISYPRIVSEAGGAVALNEKIASLYAPLIEKLRGNTEENELYRVGFNAAYTGKDYCTLMIHFTEFGGWQYSEGGESQRFFYYDGINDCELTVDEYLASMDVDRDKALAGALWSYDLARAGYTADYDGEAESDADTEYRLPESDKVIRTADENILYYQRFTEFADSVTLNGAYVDPTTVTLYFSGQMYTTDTFTCVLDRETLMPVRPNYKGIITLSAADTDKIEILFKDGEVVSATAPEKYADSRITVHSHKVTVYSDESFDQALLSVNGGTPRSWGNAGGSYNFYTDGYTEYDELKSVVLHLDDSSAPPVRSVIYSRDAYSIFNGGKLGVRQYVEYPMLLPDTAAEEVFNQKIADIYNPIIQSLVDGDDRKTYNISYSYTFTDGVVAFAVDVEIGRQGTEGGSYRQMYYFDVTNDRELTMEEYAARLGVDIEKAKDGALWSYDLGSAGYAGGDAICADTLGGDEVEPENGKFYYKKHGAFDKSVTFDGIGVSESEVVLYMSGHAFISNIFTVTLDKAILLPIRPNYALEIDASSAKDGEFEIRLGDGEVNSVTLPEGTKNVTITASYISFDSDIPFKTDTFKVNGEKWGLGYNASFDPDTGGYGYSFHISPYVPPKMLKSITIEKR